jgi:hypothetical protein
LFVAKVGVIIVGRAGTETDVKAGIGGRLGRAGTVTDGKAGIKGMVGSFIAAD